MKNQIKISSPNPTQSRLNTILPKITTPTFLIDLQSITQNMKIAQKIQQQSGAKILLSLKAFATHTIFPHITPYLAGANAASLNETLLATETFGKETHTYCPAYTPGEFRLIRDNASHIVFNSIAQFQTYKDQLSSENSPGLRLNLQTPVTKTKLYNPSAPHSRFGVTQANFDPNIVPELDGFHFHNLSSGTLEDLKISFKVAEAKFGHHFQDIEWLNLGGGHFICHPDYDVEGLIHFLKEIKAKYKLQIYMEPGEGLLIDTGYLVTEVLDIVQNEKQIAILNISATAHMPDVLEMPYRPTLTQEDPSGPHTYILGSNSCLTGDIIGEYSFKHPLKIGDKLCFESMSEYTMVKTTNFNGLKPPNIAILNEAGFYKKIKTFDYHDFKNRLS